MVRSGRYRGLHALPIGEAEPDGETEFGDIPRPRLACGGSGREPGPSDFPLATDGSYARS